MLRIFTCMGEFHIIFFNIFIYLFSIFSCLFGAGIGKKFPTRANSTVAVASIYSIPCANWSCFFKSCDVALASFQLQHISYTGINTRIHHSNFTYQPRWNGLGHDFGTCTYKYLFICPSHRNLYPQPKRKLYMLFFFLKHICSSNITHQVPLISLISWPASSLACFSLSSFCYGRA